MPQKIRIAAADSSAENKSAADFVCTGKNDELVITQAIALLKNGGTVQLMDGSYRIDSFPFEGNSAIFFGYNDGNARVINFIGDTENKSYNTHHGVTLHVTETALKTIHGKEPYRVFCGTSQRPEAPGAFFTYTFVNNVNFQNFYLFFHDASRPLIGIDCSKFGSSKVQQIGIFTENYFPDRFLHRKPAVPVKDCIGLVSNSGACDEMARAGYDTVDIGGLYAGFVCCGVDHLIMRTCNAARCCFGYIFYRGAKTLTMINCSDEGNRHLPRFYGTGHLSCIDFNIERFNADFIPDDPEGSTQVLAEEEIPGGWHGILSYTLEGEAFGKHPFWANGSGLNMKTLNLNHSRYERPDSPEFLESYFDRVRNQNLTWNGEHWCDPNGNPAD